MAAPDLPSLIRAELAGHAWWVIYLRYGCAAAVILCTMILTQNMGARLDAAPLYGIAGALVGANLLYGVHLSRAARRLPPIAYTVRPKGVCCITRAITMYRPSITTTITGRLARTLGARA